MSDKMATALKIAGACRMNIVISGGTGSGKTTMLNALSKMIDPGERVLTIEDAAELRLQQPHWLPLETRPPNLEGQGAITIGDLVKNALRMRPDRIILGEIRGAEAFDLLAAMNTGHDGSMCTLHANSPRECLGRMENMILMGDIKIPKEAIRRQIAESVDLIVQVKRLRDGSRRTTNITEVIGMEGDVIVTQELFNFEYLGRGRGRQDPRRVPLARACAPTRSRRRASSASTRLILRRVFDTPTHAHPGARYPRISSGGRLALRTLRVRWRGLPLRPQPRVRVQLRAGLRKIADRFAFGRGLDRRRSQSLALEHFRGAADDRASEIAERHVEGRVERGGRQRRALHHRPVACRPRLLCGEDLGEQIGRFLPRGERGNAPGALAPHLAWTVFRNELCSIGVLITVFAAICAETMMVGTRMPERLKSKSSCNAQPVRSGGWISSIGGT